MWRARLRSRAPSPRRWRVILRGLVLDLLEVDFLGSVGVRILLEAQERIGDDNRFAVVAEGPAAGRILRLLAMDELLSVHETVVQALRWVTAGQPGGG